MRDALSAGLAPHDLEILGRLLNKSRPAGLGERPVTAGQRGQQASSLEKAHEDAARDEEPDPSVPISTSVLLAKLTDIAESLTKQRASASSQDPLERALEGLRGTGLADGVSTSLSLRKGAAARHLLVQAVQDRPEHFTEFFDAKCMELLRDRLAGSSLSPVAVRPGMARDYLERRSKITLHKPTVNWV